MAKTIPRAALQTLMKDNMKYDEYGFNKLFALYSEILNREYMLEYKPMSSESFKRVINDWASVEGGWLIVKNDDGLGSLYYKRCCRKHNLSKKKWHDRADKLMNWGKSLCHR